MKTCAGGLVLTAAFALASSCHASPRPAEALPLTVEYAGCAAVRAGPICEIPASRQIRLWIDAADGASISIRLGASPPASYGPAARGGRLVRVDVPEGARTLVVEASKATGSATFRLALAPSERAPELEEADALRKAGDVERARGVLARLSADPRPWLRAKALGKLARLERTAGLTEEAIGHFRDAVREARATGLVSDEVNDSFALAYTLVYQGRRFSEARAVLSALDPRARDYPEGRAVAPYYLGLIAYETGDLRTALRRFRASAEASERLDLQDYRLAISQARAGALAMLGRDEEAERLLRDAQHALGPEGPACAKARVLTNRGWFALRASEGAADRVADAIASSREALGIYRAGCPDPAELVNVLTNLALAELRRNQPLEARRYVDEARRILPRPDARLEAWWHIVDGRIAMNAGEPRRALAAYERLADMAQRTRLVEARFEAMLGRALALDALGRAAEADDAFLEAEAQLEDSARLVPLGEGRETFFARREESDRLWIDFLVRRARGSAPGEPSHRAWRRVAAAAQRIRGRLLAALAWVERVEALGPEERAAWEEAVSTYRRERDALEATVGDDWQHPRDRLERVVRARRDAESDLQASLDQALARLAGAGPGDARRGGPLELPEPREGELQLAYVLASEGWIGIGIARDAVTVRTLGRVSPSDAPERLARDLLAPFREALSHARSLRVAPFGALEAVDFHALPWEGRPLVASVPVTYAVGLSRGEGRRREDPRAAVVVADARGDLPEARIEAARVEGALSGSFEVVRLEGRAATHHAVRAALDRPGVAVLHYIGHAAFEGRDGWESGLALADGGRLTIGDIVALPHAPRVVVLSACDTARTSEAFPSEGLGLAHAFVVSGADAVIAATRPVRDDLAARLMPILYEGSPTASWIDVGRSLQRAQQTVAGEAPGADWASFRVLVP